MVAAPEHEHCVHTPGLHDGCDWVTRKRQCWPSVSIGSHVRLFSRVQVVQYVYHINFFNCIVTYHG